MCTHFCGMVGLQVRGEIVLAVSAGMEKIRRQRANTEKSRSSQKLILASPPTSSWRCGVWLVSSLHSRSPSDRCYKYLFTSHWIMKPTPRLLQHALRLTLFTHEHCSLCVNVKDVMAKVWDRRHFEYGEVDILAPENQKWKSLYEFDIPVVSFITAVWEERVTHAGRFISIELLRCLHGMGN